MLIILVLTTLMVCNRYGLVPSGHAYASAIHACAKQGLWTEALAVLNDMTSSGIKPSVSWNSGVG